MVIRPLCTSEDLGGAIAFAKARYPSLAEGARPAVHSLTYTRGPAKTPYFSYGTVDPSPDVLLCRFVLAETPDADVVQIIKARAAQSIFIFKNYWSSPGVLDLPLTKSTSSDTAHLHHPTTGGFISAMGSAAAPVVLTSSDPSVVSVAVIGTTTSFATIQAFAESLGIAGALKPFDAHNHSITEYALTYHGPGKVTFTLSQPASGVYTEALPFVSREHIFPQDAGPNGAEPIIFEAGGAVAGGRAGVDWNSDRYFTSDGGAICAGKARFAYAALFAGAGGAVAGGIAFEWTGEHLTGDGGAVVGGSSFSHPGFIFSSIGGAVAGGGILGGLALRLSAIGGAVAGGGIILAGIGEIVAGGAASMLRSFRFDGAGGAVAAGEAEAGRSFRFEGFGGGVVTGTFSPFRFFRLVGAGGAVAGGATAPHVRFSGSGGGVGAGAGVIMYGTAVAGFGGVVVSGAILGGITLRLVTEGGCVAGGASGAKSGRDIYLLTSGGAVAGGGALNGILAARFPSVGGVVAGGSSPSGGGLLVLGGGGVVASGGALNGIVTVRYPVTGGGGAVVAGLCSVFSGIAVYGDGGVIAGGAAKGLYLNAFDGIGGIIASGGAGLMLDLLATPLPTADSFTAPQVPYDNAASYSIALRGHPARSSYGSVLTYDIVSAGAGCTVSISGSNAVVALTTAPNVTTSFVYTVTETANGVAATSEPATVNLSLASVLPLPWVDPRSLTVPYASRTNQTILLLGHAARGGSLTYNLAGVGSDCTVTVGGNNATFSFTGAGSWPASTYFDYSVTETANGIAKTSATARIDVAVQAPVTVQASFTITKADNKTGTLWTITSTTPAMPDASDVTLLWEISSKPGTSACYLTSTNGSPTEMTPDVPGQYAITLTVTDAYGGTSKAYSNGGAPIDVVAAIEPPTAASFPVSLTWDQSLEYGYLIVLQGTSKRGGTLVYNLVSGDTHCKFIDPATGAALPDGGTFYQNDAYFFGSPFAWLAGSAGSTNFTYTVTETAGGISRTSAPATVTISIAAPLPFTVAGIPGKLTWSGGSAPYTLGLYAPWTGTPPTLYAIGAGSPKQFTVPTTGWCTSGGYLRVADAYGHSGTALLSECGVPSCAVALTYTIENVVISSSNPWGYDAIIFGGTSVPKSSGAIQMSGTYQNLTFSVVMAGGRAVVAPQATGTPSTGTGSVRYTDSGGSYIDIPFSAFGIQAASTKSWVLKWTNPRLNAITYPYYQNSQPQQDYIISYDGTWRAFGMLTDFVLPNTYGSTGAQMDADMGINFTNESFPFAWVQNGHYYYYMYYQRMYHWE